MVIPGIGGSVLRRGDTGPVLWDVSVGAFFHTLLERGGPFEALTLSGPDHDDGVRAAGLIEGVSIIPGFWSYGDYRPLTASLQTPFGATNVLQFPYDWRRSNGVTAERLKVFIDRELSTRPVGTQLTLVAHSMGGLVARSYLANGGAERCSLLVTIGTPYRGAAKALGAICSGIKWVPGKTGDRLRVLLRSLPAVHELLPTYDCFVQPNGSRVGLSVELPTAIGDTGLFERAAEFHASTQAAVEALGTEMSDTIAVVGQRQPTTTLARLKDGEIELLPDAQWSNRDSTVRGMGDGTVPRGSAQPPEWRGVSGAHTVSGRHVNLPSGSSVLGVITAAVQGREYQSLGEEGGFALDVTPVVTEGEPVIIEARHGDDRLGLEVTVRALGDNATKTVRRHPLQNLGGGDYQRVIRDLAPGAYDVSVSGIVDGAPRKVTELVTICPPAA